MFNEHQAPRNARVRKRTHLMTYPVTELTTEIERDLGTLNRSSVDVNRIVEHAIYDFYGYCGDYNNVFEELFCVEGFYECGVQQEEDYRMFLQIVDKIKTYLRESILMHPPEPDAVITSIKCSRPAVVIRWSFD